MGFEYWIKELSSKSWTVGLLFAQKWNDPSFSGMILETFLCPILSVAVKKLPDISCWSLLDHLLLFSPVLTWSDKDTFFCRKLNQPQYSFQVLRWKLRSFHVIHPTPTAVSPTCTQGHSTPLQQLNRQHEQTDDTEVMIALPAVVEQVLDNCVASLFQMQF